MGSASDTTVHLRFPFDNKDGALEPGKALLVGTGIEDYFNSGFAFGFFGKTFHNDLSGLSHVHGSTGHGMKAPRPGWFSAYRCVSREQLQLQLHCTALCAESCRTRYRHGRGTRVFGRPKQRNIHHRSSQPTTTVNLTSECRAYLTYPQNPPKKTLQCPIAGTTTRTRSLSPTAGSNLCGGMARARARA